MSQRHDLLVELGTEELPPKALKGLSESFTNSFVNSLEQARLNYTSVESYATPRRLAVLVKGVEARQADEVVEKRGPAIQAAFAPDGSPTRAAEGWARGLGIDVADAERLVTDKGEWLLYNATVPGKGIEELVQGFIDTAVKQLPIPKAMRWGSGSHQFIRPLHTLTVLLDSKVLPAELFGVQSDNKVNGHRFHHPEQLTLTQAADYADVLTSGHVVASFAQRREAIREAVVALAKTENAVPVWDEDLIDEVASLVEFPVALAAGFDESFLAVPKEALIYTMKDDQRYFPLVDQQGELLPRFIFITNIESRDPQQVISGNEKVVRPRLADAQFFFETDKKTKLSERLNKLDSVLFQKELGSIGDKARRMEATARFIADELKADKDAAARAGLLAKADLVSSMVMEFPEVQGVMGMHYARHDGESETVAQAIEAHYRPRYAGDELPNSLEGCAVALADKLDTLAGIFGIGQTPSGDRDPFGLRRAAIGMLRILVEKELPLDLVTLVRSAVANYGSVIKNPDEVTDNVVDFLLGRFRAWYQDQAISVDVIQAVLARRPTVALDFDRRVKAVAEFRTNPQAEALAAANKRVSNILAKSDEQLGPVQPDLLVESAEKALYDVLNGLKDKVSAAAVNGDYAGALSALATLRAPVDEFFDSVMVNADDDAVRRNRLSLLDALRNEFLKVADISLLQS
ncbi:glycine--tRNA ligase subunit beta [Aliidiomarina haloalkalitolerans]|uniref:Glycine--tRNA ligase beta subunit n=1 Tax=Aliidiomarina haloalkalitolerans TaxID=859059 RepID=A0A432VS37_9GAMM|nr:glycine--tRNA ligase subunit beta [Aliidiomarina haloalkalitolerans]RUO19171.1 glycine--tRNA ligase subunit beta [Aliidiomarina haloalkalitolerans]